LLHALLHQLQLGEGSFHASASLPCGIEHVVACGVRSQCVERLRQVLKLADQIATLARRQVVAPTPATGRDSIESLRTESLAGS
jgi:hypothetical protein